MKLEEQFKTATAFYSGLPKTGPIEVRNEDKCALYAYYKQATVGPCCTAKPPFYQLTEKAKWRAWSSLGQMDSLNAKYHYVSTLISILNQVVTYFKVEKYIQEKDWQSLLPFIERCCQRLEITVVRGKTDKTVKIGKGVVVIT